MIVLRTWNFFLGWLKFCQFDSDLWIRIICTAKIYLKGINKSVCTLCVYCIIHPIFYYLIYVKSRCIIKVYREVLSLNYSNFTHFWIQWKGPSVYAVKISNNPVLVIQELISLSILFLTIYWDVILHLQVIYILDWETSFARKLNFSCERIFETKQKTFLLFYRVSR